MQKRRSSGLGNIAGLTDTYWNRNKKNSLEGKLDKLTKIFAAIFFIFTIITWFIK
jgi:preprotein translocase subunit SecG